MEHLTVRGHRTHSFTTEREQMQITAKIGECNVRSCDSRQWDKTNKNDNILYLDIKTVYAANLGL